MHNKVLFISNLSESDVYAQKDELLGLVESIKETKKKVVVFAEDVYLREILSNHENVEVFNILPAMSGDAYLYSTMYSGHYSPSGYTKGVNTTDMDLYNRSCKRFPTVKKESTSSEEEWKSRRESTCMSRIRFYISEYLRNFQYIYWNRGDSVSNLISKIITEHGDGKFIYTVDKKRSTATFTVGGCDVDSKLFISALGAC